MRNARRVTVSTLDGSKSKVSSEKLTKFQERQNARLAAAGASAAGASAAGASAAGASVP